MAEKRALITGVSGQDGSYLAELLLEQGYQVHGISRNLTSFGSDSECLPAQVRLHAGAIENYEAIAAIVASTQPAECYHLAGQTFIRADPESELATIRTNTNGTHHVLTALREHAPECRL